MTNGAFEQIIVVVKLFGGKGGGESYRINTFHDYILEFANICICISFSFTTTAAATEAF